MVGPELSAGLGGGVKTGQQQGMKSGFLSFPFTGKTFQHPCLTVGGLCDSYVPISPSRASLREASAAVCRSEGTRFLLLFVFRLQFISHQLLSLWLRLGARAGPRGVTTVVFFPCSSSGLLSGGSGQSVLKPESSLHPGLFFESASLLVAGLRRQFP